MPLSWQHRHKEDSQNFHVHYGVAPEWQISDTTIMGLSSLILRRCDTSNANNDDGEISSTLLSTRFPSFCSQKEHMKALTLRQRNHWLCYGNKNVVKNISDSSVDDSIRKRTPKCSGILTRFHLRVGIFISPRSSNSTTTALAHPFWWQEDRALLDAGRTNPTQPGQRLFLKHEQLQP